MGNFLKLADGKVQPSGMIIQTKSFADIWQRDKSTSKEDALKELAYIYYAADWRSEYNNYMADKEQQLGEDIFGDRNYKPDELVKAGIEKYKDLQRVPSLILLDNTRLAVNSISYYLKEITINENDSNSDKKDKAKKFDGKKLLGMIKDMGMAFDSINTLEQKIKKEEQELSVKIRGSGIVGPFEDPESAIWL